MEYHSKNKIITKNPKSFKDIKFAPLYGFGYEFFDSAYAKIELDNGHWVILRGSSEKSQFRHSYHIKGEGMWSLRRTPKGVNNFEMTTSDTEQPINPLTYQTEAQVMNHIRYLSKLTT